MVMAIFFRKWPPLLTALCVIFADTFGVVVGVTFNLEAEEFAKDLAIQSRETASNKQAVWMVEGNVLKLEFCLTKESNVLVSDVVVSNDGEEDVIAVLLDWEELTSFRTFSLSLDGKGWADYKSSGSVGTRRRLSSGRHTLALNVTQSDKHGVEVDRILVTVDDDGLESDVFRCRVFCFDNIGYSHVFGRDFIASARAEQRSSKTKCAEVDNIKVPFYHRSVKSFEIKAVHPQYKAFVNVKRPDFTNCELALENLWRFQDFKYTNKEEIKLKAHHAVLTNTKNENFDIIVIFFNLRGPLRGHTDSEIGSILSFALKDTLAAPITLGVQYLTRSTEWSTPAFKTFSPDDLNMTVAIPDFTWYEGPKNVLRILLPLDTDRVVDLDYISLRKRPVKEEMAFKVVENGDLVLEGIDVDFWWQNGKKMTVHVVDEGRTYETADYIRLYQKVPWSSEGFAETFVLYQDGMVRILPITPPGIDQIPFGSSVVIGQSIPFLPRPSASIRHIDVNLKKMEIDVFYENDNTAKLELKSSFDETSLLVSDMKFKGIDRWPFLVLTSMWIADGNSDVDHVSVNSNAPRKVFGNWKNLYGTSFAFFRKCLSKHNTLSPDIRIEILET